MSSLRVALSLAHCTARTYRRGTQFIITQNSCECCLGHCQKRMHSQSLRTRRVRGHQKGVVGNVVNMDIISKLALAGCPRTLSKF